MLSHVHIRFVNKRQKHVFFLMSSRVEWGFVEKSNHNFLGSTFVFPADVKSNATNCLQLNLLKQ